MKQQAIFIILLLAGFSYGNLEITTPPDDAVLSGELVIIAEASKLLNDERHQVVLQYRQSCPTDTLNGTRHKKNLIAAADTCDFKVWNTLDSTSGLVSSGMGEFAQSWLFIWNSNALTSGLYEFRAVQLNAHGRAVAKSEIVQWRINRAPVAAATLSGFGNQVDFSGAPSFDPDGQILQWIWDFGDSTGDSGQFVSHTYQLSDSTGRTFDIALTVRDNQDETDKKVFRTTVTVQDTPRVTQDSGCSCTSIEIRTSGNASQKYAPQKGWHDGKTLGPLNQNPGNSDNVVGFLWEVVAKVTGDPSRCTETQIAKATTTFLKGTKADCEKIGGTWMNTPQGGVCVAHTPWSGTGADLNADGANDIDVSTPAKCAAFGGTWANGKCNLQFPQDPNAPGYKGYKPHYPTGKSPYDSPKNGLKYHQGDMIYWLVTQVHIKGGQQGSNGKADLIALIRGSNGKYCFRRVTANLTRGGSKETNQESLDVGPEMTNQDAIPGVPFIP